MDKHAVGAPCPVCGSTVWFGGKGAFEDTLAVLDFAIALPSFVTWIPETYSITTLGFNWEIRRWEGKRFYAENPVWPAPRLAGLVQLWKTAAGRLVGAVHPEGAGDAHLQVHPDFRAIEVEMMAWAEEHLTVQRAAGRRQVECFVYDYDAARQHLLAARGYSKTGHGGVMRRLRLADHPLPRPQLAPGYTLRTTHPDNLDDGQRIADTAQRGLSPRFSHRAGISEFHAAGAQFPCGSRFGGGGAGWRVRGLRGRSVRRSQPPRHLRTGLHPSRSPPPRSGRGVDARGPAATPRPGRAALRQRGV